MFRNATVSEGVERAVYHLFESVAKLNKNNLHGFIRRIARPSPEVVARRGAAPCLWARSLRDFYPRDN